MRHTPLADPGDDSVLPFELARADIRGRRHIDNARDQLRCHAITCACFTSLSTSENLSALHHQGAGSARQRRSGGRREAGVPKREGNKPKRRIAPPGTFPAEFFHRLAAETRYAGSANHKRRPSDYGFHPAQNPRPSKSLCDGVRGILREEALEMLTRGINAQMVSSALVGCFPKFVWAVDAHGEVYEAKIGEDGASYHGYRLGEDEREFRRWVIETWNARHVT